MLSLPILSIYRLDPNDFGLIINEQAINLTSQFTNEVRKYITMEEFIQEIRTNEKNRNLYIAGETMKYRGKSMKDLSKYLKESEMNEVEEKNILKRW
jgi:hypothetical protein